MLQLTDKCALTVKISKFELLPSCTTPTIESNHARFLKTKKALSLFFLALSLLARPLVMVR